MNVQLIYPSDPLDSRKPDEAYEEEFKAAGRAGIACSIFSSEDFDLGNMRVQPPISAASELIYRGWMLHPDKYTELQSSVENNGGKLLTSTTQYKLCHYLPKWYHQCEELTPKTIFLSPDADFSSSLIPLRWSKYFVKDYVKSLTTTRSSVAESVTEVVEIIDLLKKYRGAIEGGVCVREFEDLLPESEERYFVFKKTAFSRDGIIPNIVKHIADRIESPFFSVDIVLSTNGSPRLIELGDGQVSDRKKWPAEKFVEIFHG